MKKKKHKKFWKRPDIRQKYTTAKLGDLMDMAHKQMKQSREWIDDSGYWIQTDKRGWEILCDYIEVLEHFIEIDNFLYTLEEIMDKNKRLIK